MTNDTSLLPTTDNMKIYPAIDLKNGSCVRLYQGEIDQATVFSDNPAEQARLFQRAGAEWIHLVDLNGAFEGRPVNAKSVAAIVDAVDIPVQLGGGIRNIATIDYWFEKGLSRIILGTAALKDPDLVKLAARSYPGKIAIGIDARDGFVATEGWAETSLTSAETLAKSFEDIGISAIIYTDIRRDGAMKGPNIDAISTLNEAISIPVIASGGVSNLDDLKALKSRIPDLDGVITGRALYDKAFTISDAKSAIC